METSRGTAPGTRPAASQSPVPASCPSLRDMNTSGSAEIHLPSAPPPSQLLALSRKGRLLETAVNRRVYNHQKGPDPLRQGPSHKLRITRKHAEDQGLRHRRLKRLPWKRWFSARYEAEIKSREMRPKADEEALQHLRRESRPHRPCSPADSPGLRFSQPKPPRPSLAVSKKDSALAGGLSG